MRTTWRSVGAVLVLALVAFWFAALAAAPASAENSERHAAQPMALPLPPPPLPTASGSQRVPRDPPTHYEGDPKGQYLVNFRLHGAYVGGVCLKSDSSVKNNPPGNRDRQCSGWKGDGYDWGLMIPYAEGDHIYVDVDIKLGKTKDDIDITGAKECTLSGTVQAAKLDCDIPIGSTAQTMATPEMVPFDPATAVGEDGTRADLSLLNLLAWCVTAAGVAGLIFIGISMSLQLRRGEPGEFSENWRGSVIVAVSCILAMTAAPIVEFLNIPLP